MKDYQQRVIDEKEELDKKIESLSEFIRAGRIFSTLSLLERDRLRDQLQVMIQYSFILRERIGAFEL